MDPEQNCWHLNENELYDVKAGKIKHTVPCFGYFTIFQNMKVF